MHACLLMLADMLSGEEKIIKAPECSKISKRALPNVRVDLTIDGTSVRVQETENLMSDQKTRVSSDVGTHNTLSLPRTAPPAMPPVFASSFDCKNDDFPEVGRMPRDAAVSVHNVD